MPLINMEDEVFNDGKVHTRQQSMALVRSASKAQRSAAPLQAKCLSMSPGMDPRDVTTKAEFDALIEKTGDQLIVVDFTAAWCGPCQKIKPIFNALANEYAHVIFVKVDVDDNQETAAACNVKDMPTFQFYKMGKMVHSIRGADQQALRDGVEQHHGLSLLAAKHSRAYLVLRESSKISNHADCQCRGSTSLLVQRRGARRGGGGAPGGGRPAANPPKHAA